VEDRAKIIIKKIKKKSRYRSGKNLLPVLAVHFKPVNSLKTPALRLFKETPVGITVVH